MLDAARRADEREQAAARQRMLDEADRQRDTPPRGDWANAVTELLPVIRPVGTLGQELMYRVQRPEEHRRRLGW